MCNGSPTTQEAGQGWSTAVVASSCTKQQAWQSLSEAKRARYLGAVPRPFSPSPIVPISAPRRESNYFFCLSYRYYFLATKMGENSRRGRKQEEEILNPKVLKLLCHFFCMSIYLGWLLWSYLTTQRSCLGKGSDDNVVLLNTRLEMFCKFVANGVKGLYNKRKHASLSECPTSLLVCMQSHCTEDWNISQFALFWLWVYLVPNFNLVSWYCDNSQYTCASSLPGSHLEWTSEPDDLPPTENLNSCVWFMRRGLNCIIFSVTSWTVLYFSKHHTFILLCLRTDMQHMCLFMFLKASS